MTVEEEELERVTPSIESRHATVEDVEWEEAKNQARKSVKRKLDVEPNDCDEVCIHYCIGMCEYESLYRTMYVCTRVSGESSLR